MAVKKQKSSLASRLGDKARQAFDENKTVEAEFDSQAGLPSGIDGGVARLVECKFIQIAEGKKNAGKDMFFASGIVVSPLEHNGVRLAGLRTMITEPLYDTPTRSRKTVEDHLEWVMNELKKLGIDMSEMSIDDIEDVAGTLKEQQPYFRFRTWSGTKQEIEKRGNQFFVGTKGPYATEMAAKNANPYAGTEPMVQHTWNGATEFIEDESELGGVEDETEEVVVKSPPKPGKAKKPVKAKVVEVEEEEEEVEEEVNLAELAIAADEGDQDAATQISDLALAAGIDENTINSADSWGSVVGLMSEDSSDDEDEEDEEEADWKPEKGEVYPFKAPGKKKAIDCEVTDVFEGKQTVNLKNLDDEKVYKSVPWSKLEQ